MAAQKATGQKTRSTAEALGLDNPVEGEQDVAGAELEALAAFKERISQSEPLQDLMGWCIERAAVDTADQWAVMAAEVARIMQGADAVEVLSESKTVNGKDVAGKPFIATGFTLMQSDFTEGWPFYANISATINADGETRIINCGGIKVIASLRRLEELEAFPTAMVVKATTTKGGNTVLDLVMPDHNIR
jgi:hypothetical protein